jgi:DNA-cytosine methyltransferase
MAFELMSRVRCRFRELLKDPFVNRWLPRCRTVGDLCVVWTKKARIGEETGVLPQRARALVRLAQERYRPLTMAEARAAAANERFTVVSLFAGAGGSSLGYQLAGGKVRAVVEFSPSAARTYNRNHPSCLIEQRDIRAILNERDGVANLLHRAGLARDELDILDSSPPCKPFSLGGPGIGDQTRETVHGGVKQTHSASLPFEYAKFLHRARPKVSIMENVTGLPELYPELLENILEALRFDRTSRAYYADWRILSAGDYGVPQNRRRIIIISIRTDVAERVGIHSDEEVLQVFPRPTHGMVSIRSAFEGLEQGFEDERPYLTSIRASQLPRLLRQLQKCPPKTQRLKNVKTNFTLARCSWDIPAPTLVVAGQKPDGLSGAIHPELDRKFTVPELKRLFGLPDDFILTGTIDQAVECICNMVPPLLTKAVAESVYERVMKPSRELVGGLGSFKLGRARRSRFSE